MIIIEIDDIIIIIIVIITIVDNKLIVHNVQGLLTN